jgi:hypothetical protein
LLSPEFYAQALHVKHYCELGSLLHMPQNWCHNGLWLD